MGNLLVAFLFGMSASFFLVYLAFRYGPFGHGRSPVLVPGFRRLPAPRRAIGYDRQGRPLYTPSARTFQKRA